MNGVEFFVLNNEILAFGDFIPPRDVLPGHHLARFVFLRSATSIGCRLSIEPIEADFRGVPLSNGAAAATAHGRQRYHGLPSVIRWQVRPVRSKIKCPANVRYCFADPMDAAIFRSRFELKSDRFKGSPVDPPGGTAWPGAIPRPVDMYD